MQVLWIVWHWGMLYVLSQTMRKKWLHLEECMVRVKFYPSSTATVNKHNLSTILPLHFPIHLVTCMNSSVTVIPPQQSTIHHHPLSSPAWHVWLTISWSRMFPSLVILISPAPDTSLGGRRTHEGVNYSSHRSLPTYTQAPHHNLRQKPNNNEVLTTLQWLASQHLLSNQYS